MTEFVWHGRGGQGAFTAARILGVAATLFSDRYALSFPTFGPERRGAPVLGFTKIDNSHIADRSEIIAADYRIYLDETLLGDGSKYELKQDGVLLVIGSVDSKNIKNSMKTINIDATSLAIDILGKPIVNTAMLGALAAVWDGITLDALQKAIAYEMKSSIAEKNIVLLTNVYNETKKKLL
jgi:pyruvate ferredoxin oxidoreductase gamma subunit